MGDRDHPAVIYDYTATRERAGPERFLKEYRGHLQADAYVAYDSSASTRRVEWWKWGMGRTRGVHVHQAMESDSSRMRAVLLMIAELYAVKKLAPTWIHWRRSAADTREGSRSGARAAARLSDGDSRAVVAEERSATGGGLHSEGLGGADAILRGPGSIDRHNHTERSLRGWAVGRNSRMFFGSDRGGRTAAVLPSFVASCELLKVDPFVWFCDVLSRIAAHPVTRLDELLPHPWTRPA